MIRSRFSPIAGIITMDANLNRFSGVRSTLTPILERSVMPSRGRVGMHPSGHLKTRATPRGALLMVVLVLAFALNACSQPRPPQTQNVVSAVTYHAARSVSRETASTKVLPVRLSIPAIGVDAPIEAVGVTTTGDLAIPAQNPWQDVGWYSSGPLPGELGSSVIDGHLDRPGGYPAVFWRLRDLNVGNEVIVIDTQGKTLHFRVTAIEYYPPKYAPVEQIFANQGARYLNLITCAGDWIPSQHQTTLRLVVYTTME